MENSSIQENPNTNLNSFQNKNYFLNRVLFCVLGFILGWVIAIYSTPYNKKDETKLNRFANLVGTFLTGYILSKCDKLFERLTNPDFLLSSLQGGRILLFLSFFGLSWIVVFVYRRYATGELPSKAN